MTSDAEIGRLTIAEAQALLAVQWLTDEYERTRNPQLLREPLDAAHEAWMRARAACRNAVLERLEAS